MPLHSCYQFERAIVRKPASSVVDGLRAMDTGAPDYALMCSHHDDYIEALRAAGARVIELGSLDAYPDACFVEDTAICLPEGVVLMRPGAPSRAGEVEAIAPALRDLVETVLSIDDGYIEGGDILICDREILVGRSARTDAAGIDALRLRVADWGYPVREVETPAEVLHFKTDCSLLDENTILSTARLAATGCFADYEVIETAPGEEAAANSIRFNDFVIMPSGFPETAGRLRDAGYRVREVGNSECAKIDGGMSCLSLRFW
jgi:dimethylargininase